MSKTRVLIMGAAGRDFHNFNVYFRDNADYDVVAFTATQIPNIEGRLYPAELAGRLYPKGIAIYPESDLVKLIAEMQVDQVVFAYSDIPHVYTMHQASIVLAAGADFRLMGGKTTMIKSAKPVVSICAVRTGSGKSQTTRRVVSVLRDLGYKPHIDLGAVIYAGVDYERILREAEKEADIIVWDGGNNDLPFYQPDLHIVVDDPHRPGHDLTYHPGETNLRLADVVVINKIDTANRQDIATVRRNIRSVNPQATVIEAASPIFVEDPSAIVGRNVLVIEDGPTLTHGEMKYGAGVVAAERFGAANIIDPRPYAVGTIAETYKQYPNTGAVLPAMGYGGEQIADLAETINRTPCDLVLIATPIDLRRVLKINRPVQRVRYELQEIGQPTLTDVLKARFGR